MQKIKYFVYAIRFKTLIASIAPIMVCSALCYKFYLFNFQVFYATLSAAVLLQILTNFINDLYDFKKGSDHDNRIGPDRMVQKGYLSENEMTNAIYVVFIASLIIGSYLVSVGGFIILIIGLSSFLFAYLYTATRFAIAYNGFGEIFVFLYFGVIATFGTFYLQNLDFKYDVIILGAIMGCLNINLLVINNLRDYLSDKEARKNTLVVKYGLNFGKLEFLFIIFLSYFFLYFFACLKNNLMIFYGIAPLLIFAAYIIYKVINDTIFINYKALPLFSLYIFVFTVLLTYNILI